MAAGQGLAARRRWAILERGANLDWSLALAAVAIGVLTYVIGDRISWSGGFGFDGRFYGELVTNFPSAVFGHGAVIPPGLGPYDGPHLTGLDSYYAFRILPSGIVWIALEVLGLSPTHGHVIGAFALLNAAMLGLATFCWCRSAGLLGLGDRAKLIGAIALIVNFAFLKSASYYPVLTDQVALGLGALSLYLWLRGATVWLALCVVVASFAWPLELAIGALLLLFPAPRDPRAALEASSTQPRLSWRPPPFGLAVGAIVGLAAVTALVVFELQGYRQIEGTDRLPLFPLSAAVTGLYVFGVVAFLLPRGGLSELLGVLRSIQVRRLVLAVGVIAVVLVAGALLTRRSGYVTQQALKDAFWSSTLDPGLFLVLLIGWFGPLLLFLYADLPRVARDAWRLGPGMVGILGIAMLGTLQTQPRIITNTLPFLVLAGVLAARRMYPFSARNLLVFLALSVVLSRVWLHIGSFGDRILQFPAQRYFMAIGPWTIPSMYAVQLGAVAIVAVTLWFLARTRRRDGGDPGAPAGDVVSAGDPIRA
jgi:hypothetical protein